MRAIYLGHEALTFSDYIDLGTGRTLTALPGGTYDVAPAGGRVVPEFPEPWFTPAQPIPPAKASAPEKDKGQAADEPAADLA